MGGSSHPQGQQLAQNWLSWLEAGPRSLCVGSDHWGGGAGVSLYPRGLNDKEVEAPVRGGRPGTGPRIENQAREGGCGGPQALDTLNSPATRRPVWGEAPSIGENLCPGERRGRRSLWGVEKAARLESAPGKVLTAFWTLGEGGGQGREKAKGVWERLVRNEYWGRHLEPGGR